MLLSLSYAKRRNPSSAGRKCSPGDKKDGADEQDLIA